jgi:hypothetical protein
MTKNISSVRSLQKLKQRSCYLSKGVINGIAAAGIAIIMFIQGKLLLLIPRRKVMLPSTTSE